VELWFHLFASKRFCDSVGTQVFKYNRSSTELSNDIHVHKKIDFENSSLTVTSKDYNLLLVSPLKMQFTIWNIKTMQYISVPTQAIVLIIVRV